MKDFQSLKIYLEQCRSVGEPINLIKIAHWGEGVGALRECDRDGKYRYDKFELSVENTSKCDIGFELDVVLARTRPSL